MIKHVHPTQPKRQCFDPTQKYGKSKNSFLNQPDFPSSYLNTQTRISHYIICGIFACIASPLSLMPSIKPNQHWIYGFRNETMKHNKMVIRVTRQRIDIGWPTLVVQTEVEVLAIESKINGLNIRLGNPKWRALLRYNPKSRALLQYNSKGHHRAQRTSKLGGREEERKRERALFDNED